MHVKMTRIKSGVTVAKGLFTLYMNIKIVTAKIKIFHPMSKVYNVVSILGVNCGVVLLSLKNKL
jgi:hypothetical protein